MIQITVIWPPRSFLDKPMNPYTVTVDSCHYPNFALGVMVEVNKITNMIAFLFCCHGKSLNWDVGECIRPVGFTHTGIPYTPTCFSSLFTGILF